MRATVDRRAFVAALRTVVPAATKGQGIAALAGVRIDVAASGVDLCCTNLDLTIGTTIDAPGSDKGSAIVPAALLLRIVSAMGGESVTVDGDATKVAVTSGEAVASLRAIDLDAWPKVAEPDGPLVELDAVTVDLLARILPMASTDANRPMLGGVHFVGGRAACTDSYRLGVLDGLPDLGPATVPADTLRAVVADGAGVQVVVGDRQASFSVGPTTWTTRLIEGEFPQFARLLPDSSPHALVVDRDAALGAVRRVQAIGADPQTVRLHPDGGKLLLSMAAADVGDVTDVVSASGDVDFDVAFTAPYLGDLLEAVEPGEVTFGLVDNLKPAVVKDGRLTLLIMPVRTS